MERRIHEKIERETKEQERRAAKTEKNRREAAEKAGINIFPRKLKLYPAKPHCIASI